MGVVYQVKSKTGECIYVGSTTATLNKRRQNHIMEARTNKATKFHKYVMSNGGWEMFDFLLIAKIDDDDIKNEEKKNIALLNPLTNSVRKPVLTKEEHMQYNREYAKKQHQTIFVCECGITTSESHKSRHQKTNLHLTKLKAKEETKSPA